MGVPLLDDITVDDVDDDNQEEYSDEYSVDLPDDPTIVHTEGEAYDLKDLEQAKEFVKVIKAARKDLNNDDLPEYEDHSTEYRGGGRARLLYDQVRGEEALKYHLGKTSRTWLEQHEQAMRVVGIVASKLAARH